MIDLRKKNNTKFTEELKKVVKSKNTPKNNKSILDSNILAVIGETLGSIIENIDLSDIDIDIF